MKKSKYLLWGMLVTLIFMLLVSFTLVGLYTSYRSTLEEMHEAKPEKPKKEQPVEKKEEPKLKDPFILLMYGIDKRSSNRDTGRPDTLMLALIDPQLLKVSLISIPRDSYVSIPGYRQKDKINSAYPKGGTELTIKTIEEWFDTDIYGYVAINFEGFVQLVDLLGGVEVEVDRSIRYDDPTDGTHIRLEKGLQVLDGQNALNFVRARLDNRGPRYYTSDYLRMERQQRVLKALGEKILSFRSLPKIFDLLKVIGHNVTTSLTPDEMDELIRTFYRFELSNLSTTSVQGKGMYLKGIWYEDIPDEEVERIKTLIKDFLERRSADQKEAEEEDEALKAG